MKRGCKPVFDLLNDQRKWQPASILASFLHRICLRNQANKLAIQQSDSSDASDRGMHLQNFLVPQGNFSLPIPYDYLRATSRRPGSLCELVVRGSSTHKMIAHFLS